MGELGQFEEVHEVVLPKFSKEFLRFNGKRRSRGSDSSPRRNKNARNVRKYRQDSHGKMEAAADG